MKVDDFAYRVARRTLELLEQEHHYKVAEETRKAICEQITREVNQILKESQ